MAPRRYRTIVAWVCTVLSLPGALLGALSLMVMAARSDAHAGVVLLLANAFAWIAYLACVSAWVAGRRVPRAWPVGGILAAASYALFPLTIGGSPGAGLVILFVGMILVLPAVLLATVVVVFHLRGEPDDRDPPALIPPAEPPGR
jgi:hypothetical protein